MNRKRRSKIAALIKPIELLRREIILLHDEEYGYREHLWKQGLDESDTADVSDDALDALNKADTLLMRALMELEKTQNERQTMARKGQRNDRSGARGRHPKKGAGFA